jgi:FkbM family methyltransferase
LTIGEKISSGDAVWIYGSGTFASQIAARALDLGLKIQGFCDHINSGKVVSDSFQDFSVSDYSLALKELVRPNIVIGVCNLYGNLHKITNNILSTSPEAVVITPVEFNNILISRGFDSIKNYWLPTLPHEIRSSKDQIEHFRDILSDFKSKELFDSILRYRVGGKLEDLNEPEPFEFLYLPPDLKTPPFQLRMVDLGACRGENLELFLQSSRHFGESVFLEPDPGNAGFLKQKIEDLGLSLVKVLNLAGWSSKTTLKFRATADGSSGFSESGSLDVIAIDTDSLAENIEVNYIKMDIEGAELEALIGAKQTILERLPHLAISIYHKPADLWELGLWIYSICGNKYSYHIRNYGHQTFDTVLYAIPNA